MGLPVTQAWGYFPPDFPSAPASVTEPLIAQGGLPGILGNYHASGTQIIADLGAAHIHTGMPILYTSGDSVLQIAADEDSFTLERLYDLCAIARRLVDPHNIGRVIARPFVATAGGQFVRTGNRRDLATPPHAPTLLNHVVDGGGTVIGVGKISDIFAGSGITANHKAHGNDEVMDRLLEAIATAPDGGLVFANFLRFRYAVRPPPRCRRLRRCIGGLRPAFAAVAEHAAARRHLRIVGGSWLRPNLAGQRPYPRICAGTDVWSAGGAARHRSAVELCRYRPKLGGSPANP